jgi:hypothetical protein
MPTPDDVLKLEFNQAFDQMRHYDTLYATAVHFIFAVYIALAAATVLFLNQPQISNATYLGLSVLYAMVAVVGVLLLAFLLRNRRDFTLAARFTNDIRRYYLARMDSDPTSAAGLPARPELPRMPDTGRPQTVHMHCVAFFNTALVSASILFFRHYVSLLYQNTFVLYFWLFIFLILTPLLVQIVWIVITLHRKGGAGTERGC